MLNDLWKNIREPRNEILCQRKIVLIDTLILSEPKENKLFHRNYFYALFANTALKQIYALYKIVLWKTA